MAQRIIFMIDTLQKNMAEQMLAF